MSKFLLAAQQTSEIAVIHCKGHQGDTAAISIGNEWAGKHTKQAATLPATKYQLLTLPTLTPRYTPEEIKKLVQERAVWEGEYVTKAGQLILPLNQRR